MRVFIKVLSIVVLCGYCCTPSFGLASDGSTAEEEAHKAHDAYVKAINSNDLDAVLEIMTDDVVFLAAGAPPMVGKDAVRPWIEGYLAAFETHWDKPVQEFVFMGEWAYERYSYKSTDTPRAGGDVIEGTGWGLIIYRLDADGKWRVARDAFGPDHP